MSKTQRFGRFEVERVLGRGGMGTVHLAHDPLIGRTVAIKEIRVDQIEDERERAELEERFRLEFRSAGKLSHPNIVTIYDVGQSEDSYFIAMEYVEGMSLAQRLKREPRPPFPVVCDLANQIAAGLDFAHDHGIVHRDIKPANVLLTSDGRPKITDFGLVKVLTSDITMTGTVLGTPAFMSPEQVTGLDVDGKSDQFSFAVILYLMLTGGQPFPADHPSAILYKIVHEEPRRPQEINRLLPAAADRMILRGLAKEPAHRYPTCSALAADLQAVLTGEATTPLPSHAPPPPHEPPPALDPARQTESILPAAAAGGPPPDAHLPASPTPPAARPRRRGTGVRWLAALAFLLVMTALGYWASARRPAASEPLAAGGPPPAGAPVAVEHALRVAGGGEGAAIHVDGEDSGATAPAEVVVAGEIGDTVRLELVAGGEVVAGRDVVLGREPPPPWEVEVAARPMTLEITSQPAGAALRVDGRDTGLTTPASWEFAPGQEQELVLTLDGHDPIRWPVDLDDLDDRQLACRCLHFPLAAAAPPGFLTVKAAYEVEAIVDGRPAGTVTRERVAVVPGRRQVVLVAEDVFLRQTQTVDVASGEERSLRVPKAVTVRVTANPANCRVSIDGRFVDSTPINGLRLVVGAHDFSFHWPALSETRTIRKTVSRAGQRIHATVN